ncbi:MAG: PAS domain-containing protein [Magnetococcales bacterium]|nr:PAS domain-containing protein [Magnetococcales bacterium]
MIPRQGAVWLLLLSFAPAILLSLRNTPWIVWVVPVVLTYVFRKQWHCRDTQAGWEQEEPPEFCFSPIVSRGSHPVNPRERWHTTVMRWRTAIDALPDGVLLLDDRFAICWFNPEAQHLLGLFPKRDRGIPLHYRMGQPILDDYLRRGDFSQAIDLPSPVNGNRMLNMRFIFLEQEAFWLLLVRDITERYQLDRQQHDFLSNISHELKTPLTVFRGVLDVLPDLTRGSVQWDNALGLLQKQSTRMQNLIEDQTALLRLGPEHPYPAVPVEMHEFLRDMLSEAEALSGARKHTFLLSVDHAFTFAVNPELLRCMVGNLLFNAVNHTPEQTEVRVVWQRDEGGQPCLTVSDNGPGIAGYHLPRLTEKYYRVTFQQTASRSESVHQGTGLGLSLVKQALERCQGRLEIVSQPGIGSRFVCRFPAVMATDSEVR